MIMDIDEPRAAVVRSTARSLAGDEVTRIVRARPVRLTRKMTVEEAFRVTVLECLAQVAANTPAIVQARDVEGLHQMRVGLRRLHVALYAFGDEFRTPALKELRKRSKAFTDAIAPARDLDVFLEELLPEPEAGGGSAEAFTLLRERAEKSRATAWDQAVDHVSSAQFSAFLDDVAAAAETHSWFAHAVGPTAYKAHFTADAPVKPTACANQECVSAAAATSSRKAENCALETWSTAWSQAVARDFSARSRSSVKASADPPPASGSGSNSSRKTSRSRAGAMASVKAFDRLRSSLSAGVRNSSPKA